MYYDAMSKGDYIFSMKPLESNVSSTKDCTNERANLGSNYSEKTWTSNIKAANESEA